MSNAMEVKQIRNWTEMDAEAEREGFAANKTRSYSAKPFGKGKRLGGHVQRLQ